MVRFASRRDYGSDDDDDDYQEEDDGSDEDYGKPKKKKKATPAKKKSKGRGVRVAKSPRGKVTNMSQLETRLKRNFLPLLKAEREAKKNSNICGKCLRLLGVNTKWEKWFTESHPLCRNAKR